MAKNMLSPVRLSSVCLSSVVCNARAPYSGGNFSTAFGTLAILDTHRKFYGDHPRGTHPSGELNPRGVAKYSDFEPIEGYRKWCKIRVKLLLITNRKSHMS